MWFKTWSGRAWHEAVPSALENHVSARCGSVQDVEPAHSAEEPPSDWKCELCAALPGGEQPAGPVATGADPRR